MTSDLDKNELIALIRSVFSPVETDNKLAILVDVPHSQSEDTPAWQERRMMAFRWTETLQSAKTELKFDAVNLFMYPRVGANNADLPQQAWTGGGDPKTLTAESIRGSGIAYSFREILFDFPLILAPTQYSATAPLKLMAAEFGFRAATMPGFSPAMIPALRLDYDQIGRRVESIKNLLDTASALFIRFRVEEQDYDVQFDLRHRKAHASGGRFPSPGQAGNLPSGECYIVPYEGELGTKSLSAGILPVQFGDEVVLYRIDQNRAVDVFSEGPHSVDEAQKIRQEPAYANIAEIGFGILKDYGLTPTGEILLDEKLGLHIAFGRSDHFGGAVGAADFSSPDQVVHLDRIYIPETMDRIDVLYVDITNPDKKQVRLMEQGAYTLF